MERRKDESEADFSLRKAVAERKARQEDRDDDSGAVPPLEKFGRVWQDLGESDDDEGKQVKWTW